MPAAKRGLLPAKGEQSACLERSVHRDDYLLVPLSWSSACLVGSKFSTTVGGSKSTPRSSVPYSHCCSSTAENRRRLNGSRMSCGGKRHRLKLSRPCRST